MVLGSSLLSLASPPVYIDVRSAAEYQQGHIEGALLMPHDRIAKLIAKADLAKDTDIILYCRSGRRAGIAEETLRALGYTNITNAGGYEEVAAELESAETSGECTAQSC